MKKSLIMKVKDKGNDDENIEVNNLNETEITTRRIAQKF